MADVLLTRSGKLFSKDDKILWNVDNPTEIIQECCCIFQNCCIGGKEAQVTLSGLNWVSTIVNGTRCLLPGNCSQFNQTYLIPIPTRPIAGCCAYGETTSVPLCALSGSGNRLAVSFKLDETTPANSSVVVILEMRATSGSGNPVLQIMWLETGLAAIEFIWELCAGVTKTFSTRIYTQLQTLTSSPLAFCGSTPPSSSLPNSFCSGGSCSITLI